MRKIFDSFKRLGRGLGLAIAYALAGLFYFAILGPYSIVSRVAARDLLQQRPDPKAKTYWRRVRVSGTRSDRPF